MGDDDFPSNELDENMGGTPEVWSSDTFSAVLYKRRTLAQISLKQTRQIQ